MVCPRRPAWPPAAQVASLSTCLIEPTLTLPQNAIKTFLNGAVGRFEVLLPSCFRLSTLPVRRCWVSHFGVFAVGISGRLAAESRGRVR